MDRTPNSTRRPARSGRHPGRARPRHRPALLKLDENAANLLLQIGASDITDADRAAHAKRMRRQLEVLTEELTGRFDEWLE